MNHIMAQTDPFVVGQVINTILIVALLSLPFVIWSKISKWSKEKNEKLDEITAELREIKEQLNRRE